MNSRFYRRQVDLAGQRVMITGCTSGTGKACAFRFAELGCQLILLGRDEGRLQQLAQEIKQALDQIAPYPESGYPNPPSYPAPELIKLDLRDIRMINELPAKVGNIDILINNAGMNLGGQGVEGVHLDDAVSMVSCNLMAPMELVSAFGREMKRRGQGHIINVCSTAAHDVYQNASVYCSTKAALEAYSQAIRHDFVDTPIRCTAICPGLVNSELHIKKMGDASQAASVCAGILPLEPDDIADQIVYSCTRPPHVQVANLASYCTNQSHSGVKGVPPVARQGSSLGAPQHHGMAPYGTVPLNVQNMTPRGEHPRSDPPPYHGGQQTPPYQQPGQFQYGQPPGPPMHHGGQDQMHYQGGGPPVRDFSDSTVRKSPSFGNANQPVDNPPYGRWN